MNPTGRRFLTGVLVAVTVGLSAQSLQWQPQQSDVTGRLRGISAVSAAVAWASGANGTLLRTVNGGATWTLARSRVAFRSVAAWAPASRWWLTIGPTGANGSTDDGQSWIPVEMIPAAGFDAFSFAPGTRVGWASGSGGRISRLTINPR